jgi:hypothetical protein
MADEPDNMILFRDIVGRLMERGVDGATLTHVVAYTARDRWLARQEAPDGVGNSATPTTLTFAAQLEEHCNRAHGVCIAMVGLRETLGHETSLAGAHQLTIDLADQAQRLKHAFDGMMAQQATR